jgi:3,4-dehydroadipyl-CoA semialdehyde dehydrogenase
MKTLRSFVSGRWHEAGGGFVPLVDPSTEEKIAETSSQGVDFGAALDFARREGGPALRRLTFAQRGELLKAISKTLREHRDELLELSRRNNGTTAGDGSFDVDGGAGTFAYYAGLSRGLDRGSLLDGDGIQLAKTEAFWAQHVLVPRHGVAVHINAFNFPAWGFAEKAACALLAGMPVLTKPATATALLTERCVELIVEAGILPDGALQLIAGGVGDLLDHLEPQDVLAFTGSAETARALRAHRHVLAVSPGFNVEADSLNAAVLGPDVQPESKTFELFLRDVLREITQKAGQKCTAVRRILVPESHLPTVRDFLLARLREVRVGNPADATVTMGPLATAGQLRAAEEGVALLAREARLLCGGDRVDGIGSPAGKGYFLAPTLLEAEDAATARVIHEHEVFGPVATLLPYSGQATVAGALIARGGGTLVTSAYSDDDAWVGRLIAEAGATTGRFYLGSEAAADAAVGSGAALPQTFHGGPGRAGGGAELGGWQGVRLYLQKVALQGARGQVDRLATPGSPA